MERRKAIQAAGKRGVHVAVLESNPAVQRYLERILAEDFEVSLFRDATELGEALNGGFAPDLVLVDWQFIGAEGREDTPNLLVRIRASQPKVATVILACDPDLNDVMGAAREGAAEVVLKPFTRSEIVAAVLRCARRREESAQSGAGGATETALNDSISFVRCSKRMREIEARCALVARADLPVLILGESGTGKEVSALLIHKLSSRSHHPFLKVNCAAMPADLLESELFGYEQGAFTGALKAKPGKFETCDKGTIFLDEIGEMPPILQAKLLQVLQDGSFSRLGGRSTVKVDVRVIAATNIDIKAAIAKKMFREDLYYRLNGFTLEMPPLRERIEEIPVLSQHFMRKESAKYGRDPLPISPSLMRALTLYEWPGNIRELENTIKRYVVLADEGAILQELVTWRGRDIVAPEGPGGGGGLKHLVRHLKGGAESAVIAQALESTRWNRKAAANELQISYKALLYKIKQYKLNPPGRYVSLDRVG